MKRALELAIPLLAIAVLFAGCGPCPAAKPAAKPAPAPAPAPAKQPAMVTSPCAVAGQTKAAGQYPSAEDVKLEKIVPDFVYLNNEFTYRIEATNVGSAAVQNVVVTDSIASNVKVSKTTPQAQLSDGMAKWSVGTLAVGEKRVMHVTAVATGPATISGCAAVTYDKPLCAEIKVLEPKIAVAVAAPKEVSLCDNIPVEYTVTNNGNADLCSVVLAAAVPEGVRSTTPKTAFDMGNVMAGKGQKMTMVAKADKTGTYTFGGNVQAEGGIKAQANTVTVKVVNCALKVEASAPDMRYIGRDAKVDIKVTNTGEGAAINAMAMASARGTLASASSGGTVAANKATWKLGTLKPGESRTMSVTLSSAAAGDVAVDASASADCCPPATAAAKTQFAGIPAILLEVIDVADPIEIGAEETYTITVTNQGSAPDKNIKVTCKLDANTQYVSSSGPTAGTFKDGTLEFAPIVALEARKQAVYKVVVKAVTAADARFFAQITSDMLTSPVTETESTHFYK